MEITNVLLSKPLTNSNIKAYATITLDDCFVIYGFRVLENKEGELYVNMPFRKDKKSGKFLNTAHPINQEFREVLVSAVLEAYHSSNKEELPVGEPSVEEVPVLV